MRRRMLCLALCVLLCAAGLAGCRTAPTAVPRRSIRIGVALYDQYDTFIGEFMTHFVAQAQEREQQEDVTITIMRASADGNQQVQNNQVEEFIEAGCDLLCVNLVDRTDVSVIIDKAQTAGLPIIFFNRELVEEDLHRNQNLYYVGADAFESARLQGQIVIDLCRTDLGRVDKNGDGVLQYVMLEGEAGHQDAVVRTEYSVAAVAGDGFRLERLEDEIANWSRSQAETKMKGWLEVHGGEIEVVFANNDDMALGAIDALKRAEIPSSQWPVVVGIDGTSVGLESVMMGEMSGTVLNDAAGQSGGVLDLACALALGGQMPALQDGKYIRLPYQIITRDNVVEYINRR